MPAGRLQRTGASIMLGGPRPPTGDAASAGERPTPQSRAGSVGSLSGSGTSLTGAQYEYPPAPPSASRTGRLWAIDASPVPNPSMAQNVPTIRQVHMKRVSSAAEAFDKKVWSDSVQHLGEDPWPAHAVPLFVFSGVDRPRPGYREEVKFTVKDEKYVNFGLRLRCGGGDRHGGGTVGLLHSPDRTEAYPGQEGQLVTITNIIVMPDSTLIVSAVGDLPFRVHRAWMPRGLRGLQCAVVEVEPAAPTLDSILETCTLEATLRRFVGLLELTAPDVARQLGDAGSKFTVFVPTTRVLDAAMRGLSDEPSTLREWAAKPDVQAMLLCHVVPGRLPLEALYSGRGLTAIDGTPLVVTFGRWPRGDPRVNDVPMEHMDIMCANGVVHSMDGMLAPARAPGLRRAGPRR